MKKTIFIILTFIIGVVIIFGGYNWYKEKTADGGRVFLSDESMQCIKCHMKENIHTAQIQEWKKSEHADKSIGCYECHKADKSDPDAFDCNGFIVSKIVSPKDCAQCHEQEVKEFDKSHHAKAGEILGTADNYLGEVAQGDGSSIQGCQSCHGSVIKIDKDGKFDYKTWPNLGIGRLNPDGTKGSCSTCHSKHNFSLEVARSPESCGKCHLGPDHPQKEIYEESIHGRLYFVKIDEMNMKDPEWILGKDYSAAPNCTTCHMGGTKDLIKTHDIGTRLSMNLRAIKSVPMENSKEKRKNMKQVCRNCHGPEWINNFYKQLDNSVALYNNSYSKPSTEIMELLKKEGKIDAIPFNEKIEWVYFELWHHEGRRARHGAAMMGPDYVQWNGFYELSRNFYFKFLPMARELGAGDYIDKLLDQPEHNWVKGVSPENFKAQAAQFAQWQKQSDKIKKEDEKKSKAKTK